MKIIETNISAYFNIKKEDRIIIEPSILEQNHDKHLISVDTIEETNKNTIKIPFAYVESVVQNSPSWEAGLLPGDAIILFDGTLNYTSTNNPLQKISEIVSRKVNTEIQVEILRNGMDYINIVLIPHQWSGQGLLG